MKIKDLRILKKEELDTKIEETRSKLSNLYFEINTGKSRKSSEVKNMKKDIARMLSIKRELLIIEILNKK